MISLKLINNDLVFDGQNKLLMISDNDELAQSCERTLTTNKNEWFLNKDFGLDYNLLHQKTINEDYLRIGIIEALTIDKRVKTILDLTIVADDEKRTALISFKIIKNDGTTVESEVLI